MPTSPRPDSTLATVVATSNSLVWMTMPGTSGTSAVTSVALASAVVVVESVVVGAASDPVSPLEQPASARAAAVRTSRAGGRRISGAPEGGGGEIR